MVSIPVKLYPAARSEHLSFNMLHEGCGQRVKQQLVCPDHGVLGRDEIAKGYEYEKGRYVVVEKDEIKKIEPATVRAMEILEFVPLGDVDPLYYDTSYYLVPDEPGRRAYVLLRQALADRKMAAVARVAMHNREYTCIVRPLEKGIAIHSMFFQNEVRSIEEMGPVDSLQVQQKELDLAHSLIETLSASFEPQKYGDTFQENLRKLIDAKLEGREVEEVEKPRLAPVVDLMAALKQSLQQARDLPRKQAQKTGEPVPISGARQPRGPEEAEAGTERETEAKARPAEGRQRRKTGRRRA